MRHLTCWWGEKILSNLDQNNIKLNCSQLAPLLKWVKTNLEGKNQNLVTHFSLKIPKGFAAAALNFLADLTRFTALANCKGLEDEGPTVLAEDLYDGWTDEGPLAASASFLRRDAFAALFALS